MRLSRFVLDMPMELGIAMGKVWKGVEYANDDEIAMAQWCEEAKDNGLLLSWYSQHDKWRLIPAARVATLNKKGKSVQRCLLKELTYTADFSLLFSNPSVAGRCGFSKVEQSTVYVDVKPSFERVHSRAEAFVIKQKLVWQAGNVYVYPVVPIELFKRTFLPRAQLISPTGKVRKVKAHVGMRTIEEFIT